MLARLTHAKLQNLHVHALLHVILVCTCEIANTRDTRDECHELALGLPHYTCGVTTGTVTGGNELQLLCSQLASLYVVMSIT